MTEISRLECAVDGSHQRLGDVSRNDLAHVRAEKLLRGSRETREVGRELEVRPIAVKPEHQVREDGQKRTPSRPSLAQTRGAHRQVPALRCRRLADEVAATIPCEQPCANTVGRTCSPAYRHRYDVPQRDPGSDASSRHSSIWISTAPDDASSSTVQVSWRTV